jgi:hypothetical protein
VLKACCICNEVRILHITSTFDSLKLSGHAQCSSCSGAYNLKVKDTIVLPQLHILQQVQCARLSVSSSSCCSSSRCCSSRSSICNELQLSACTLHSGLLLRGLWTGAASPPVLLRSVLLDS